MGVDNKTALLLSPQQLPKNKAVLQSLQIFKTAKELNYKTFDISARHIEQAYPQIPAAARSLLARFCDDQSASRDQDIRSRFRSGKAGVSYNAFYQSALLRELHQVFETLKPFTALFNWYHQLWKDGSSSRTAPCSFSNSRPQLKFDVALEGDALVLKAIVTLDNIDHGLDLLQRYHFLLLNNSTYFLLSHKDFQTLEWLRQNRPAQYANDPASFAQSILSVLEKDYKVDRHNLFPVTEIDTAPVNRVLLSEISNSFLVLTPQWLYDGFLVDGPWQETFEFTKAGEAYAIRRNKPAEQGFSKLLQGLHANFPRQLNGYFYLSFAEAEKKQWFLKAYHSLLEQDIQVVGMDLLQHFRYSGDKAITSAIVQHSDDFTITVKFKLSFGTEEVPLTDLQKLLLAGQRLILLKNGSLGVLSDEWVQQYAQIVKHARIVNKMLVVSKGMALAEANIAGTAPVLKTVIRADWWQRWQQWQEPDTVLFKIPGGIKASLRPYQQKGYEWMILLSETGTGACLADDMGLGKTLQAICFMAYRAQNGSGVRQLVVCPSSLLYNWQQELEKFAPFLLVQVYHGPQRNIEEIQKSGSRITLTTYGTLRSDIDKLSELNFDTVVIDESHNIKNPAAFITRAVSQLKAGNRIALSGTPVMNNTFDLYAQLSFLVPGMFGSREFFKREYADAIDREQDPEKTRALQKLTAPFILRRTKEQVAPDLPEKTETILWCDMGHAQKTAYESIKETIRNSLFLEIKEKGLGTGKLSVILGLLKLRQACNSLALVKGQHLPANESIKTDVLMEELKNIVPAHKALVFSQFTTMLDLLETSLKKEGIAYCRLDGNTPVAKRQGLVNNFQGEESVEKVFLLGLKAGNAGLNLTAAGYVFLFDPWWNTAVQQQAIDRTHRIGQTKNVFAYKMICRDSIEEKIILLQQRKKELAEELIGEEEGFVKSLTETDIEFLFS